MIFRAALLIFALATACSNAHRIEIDPGEKECFFEVLQPQDRMTVTYEVGGSIGGGRLDIDFFVLEPSNEVIHTHFKESTGSFSMEASRTGRYTYCFSNEMSTYARKVLSFNVHGVLFVGDEEKIAPVEREIRELSSSLQLVKDEQAYLVVRERVHRDTAESTNSRVKWWAIAQSIILFSLCAWNVHYLKSWFEVKRVL
ncbi:putative COPII-coated vesicle protein [Dioszegia hungarica]|uniref:COPII-coated vesicle protein n=1 Tax=Dioszegia hungarica TaxID=4972 RepID=A0AA38LX48_9TREE|nr:putative COPII-coated vesicle protein [Dioszegia hungarica]KAI9639537.1 putative COPII-coated vesicle protein [Dioszegia hungarica]